jgi:hypothetical protein
MFPPREARLQTSGFFGPTLKGGHTAASIEEKTGLVTDACGDLKNLPAGEI